MRERDLQDYLFNNPKVLFPGKNIQEKTREYYIHGKRIDLLFVVDGFRYIVETKAVPIAREHIGQVVEYYGLMKEYLKETNLKMILVSPSIPKWRSVFLEELGIQCVEITKIPESKPEVNKIIKKAMKKNIQLDTMIEYEKFLDPNDKFLCDDFDPQINRRKLALVNKVVKSSLAFLRPVFSEYEIVPYKISRANSSDFDYEYHKETKFGLNKFISGNIWWAFRFGFHSEMPPNDKPNISLIFNTFGLDITINAELQPSQKFLLKIIKENKNEFNELLNSHGNLWFKSYLKYQHFPYAFHWILQDFVPPGKFNADTIINSYESHRMNFNQERDNWIEFIIESNTSLDGDQIEKLKNYYNKHFNLAIRLTRRLEKYDEIWSKTYNDQNQFINSEVVKMKPFIDLFIKEDG